MKKGMVIQANRQCGWPFREGNTYRVNSFTDTDVIINVSNVNPIGTSPVKISKERFGEIFSIVPDDLCPACLKGSKAVTADWCDNCED